MKAHLLIFAAALLIPCWTKPPHTPEAPAPKPPGPFPLNMVDDAVDDDYKDCIPKMEEKIEKEYFNKERAESFDGPMQNNTVNQCVINGTKQGNKALTKEQIQAICVYTSNYIYRDFNEAVRTGKNTYGSSFKFHSLHFWLTSAIQILNINHQCQTTYRRTKAVFTGKVNDTIRFGTFASSSKKTELTDFGNETCFQIQTCLGAYVKPYSVFQDEEEVLIPPYEIFNITSDKGKMSYCNKVFVLKSAGEQSYLRCKLAHK